MRKTRPSIVELPRHLDALMSALQIKDPAPQGLRHLSDEEWGQLLSLSDQMHVTIRLRELWGSDLPQWVAARIERNLADNRARFEEIKGTYHKVARCLGQDGVEHLVLKGFAQWPLLMQHPRDRMHSDLDIFCPPEQAEAAVQALARIGYRSTRQTESFPSDQHLPTMVTQSSWQWRGNLFDPEMPLPIDLHIRFWNEESCGFGATGLEALWQRRTERSVDKVSFPALHQVDALGYSALHALRHLLWDSLALYHVYEVAWFLEYASSDADFWRLWEEWHDPSLRRLEAICFAVAKQWFQCRVPQVVEEEITQLPVKVRDWLRTYSYSPLERLFSANKDSLWLHLSLLESRMAKSVLVRRRLFGAKMPPLAAFRGDVEPGASQDRPGRKLAERVKHIEYVASRALYHARTLPPTVARGVRWWLGAGASS